MTLECTLLLKEGKLDGLKLVPAAPRPKGGDTAWDEKPWTTLGELLERARVATEAPAIAAVVMQDGRIVAEAAVGVYSVEDDTAVTLDDRFHIGSITKSMTATVVARPRPAPGGTGRSGR